MILNRDSRNELIDVETQAPRTVREDRVIGGLARALRLLYVARSAVAAEDIGRCAFVTRIESSDFAVPARAQPLAEPDLLKIGVQLHRVGVLRQPLRPAKQRGEARLDMHIVLEEARKAVCACQEFPPGGPMAFQAGQFEASKPFR